MFVRRYSNILVIITICILSGFADFQQEYSKSTLSASLGSADRISASIHAASILGKSTFFLKIPYHDKKSIITLEDLPAGYSLTVGAGAFNKSELIPDDSGFIRKIDVSLLIGSDSEKKPPLEIQRDNEQNLIGFLVPKSMDSNTPGLNSVFHSILTDDRFSYKIRIGPRGQEEITDRPELYVMAVPVVPNGLPEFENSSTCSLEVDHGTFGGSSFRHNSLAIKTAYKASVLDLGNLSLVTGQRHSFEITGFWSLVHTIGLKAKSKEDVLSSGLKRIHIYLRVKDGPVVINREFSIDLENTELKYFDGLVYFSGSTDWKMLTQTSVGSAFQPTNKSVYELDITITEGPIDDDSSIEFGVVIRS